ncbi:MAG: hybrid sensor histidine kinase/response regulator [bacterium]|nr:hybrid sensor histidine kinase/response regulator [bacterium]MDT8396047.1 hybrid sensor histidine kinase/response regulator [bacterium]
MPRNDGQTVGPILVIDDEKFFRDLMANILVDEGYEVHVVGTGAEALAACAEGRFRVVVMDLVLPDIIGTEVLARIRERDPGIAVIMVTAYASMESAIEALKAGAYDYIKKPIVKEDLVHSVQRALERQYLSIRNVQLVRQLEARIEEMKIMSREKEEVFRILDEGLVIMEDSGRIFDLNPKAVELLGGGSSPLAGTDFFETGFPVPEGFMTSVQAAGGQAVRSLVQFQASAGQAREIELLGLSMANATGPSRVLFGLRDLTGIRELERNREEFLAIVSHDLRTPLTSLKGFIEVLLNGDYDNREKFQEYLGILDSEADRMIFLISDLLDLGRLESGRMTMHVEPCSAVELIDYAMRSMEGLAAGKEVRLQLTGGSNEPFVIETDRQRFLQVLVNIYSNAINFSPQGGVVETVIRRVNGEVSIEILDEGPGVPPEEQERIFEKYHQVPRASSGRGKGSGLGLAIVKKIIDLHGGSITLQDREGRPGSRFVLRMKTVSGEDG